MSEDVIRKLAGFTPAPSAFDRDDLLFRAGRASAPSPRWWGRATATLLVTQAITLGLWLSGPSRRPAGATPAAEPIPAYDPGVPEPPAPSSYLVLSRNWDMDRQPDVPDGGAEPRRSSEDPLTAGDRRLVFD